MSNIFISTKTVAVISALSVLLISNTAFAGQVIPAPLAGVAGPYGLLAAAVAYGGYRAVNYIRNR